MAFIPAHGVIGVRPFQGSARCSARSVSVSSFVGKRVASPRVESKSMSTPRMEFEISEGVEYEISPLVIVLALIGWIVPSSLPAGIPLTNGTGLSQAFFASMNANLANFPKGPAADDPFWTLCFMWHIGMFACLIFGTIGYNLRKSQST